MKLVSLKKVPLWLVIVFMMAGCIATPNDIVKFDLSTPQGRYMEAEKQAKILDSKDPYDKKRVELWEGTYSAIKELFETTSENMFVVGSGGAIFKINPLTKANRLHKVAFNVAKVNGEFGNFDRAAEILENLVLNERNINEILTSNSAPELYRLLVQVYISASNEEKLLTTCEKVSPILGGKIANSEFNGEDGVEYGTNNKFSQVLMQCAQVFYDSGEKLRGIELYAKIGDFVTNDLESQSKVKGKADMFAAFGTLNSAFKQAKLLSVRMNESFKINYSVEDQKRMLSNQNLQKLPADNLSANALLAKLTVAKNKDDFNRALNAYRLLIDSKSGDSKDSSLNSGMFKYSIKERLYQKLAMFFLNRNDLTNAISEFSNSFEASNENLFAWFNVLDNDHLDAVLKTRRISLDIILSKLSSGSNNDELTTLAFEMFGLTKNIKTEFSTALTRAIYQSNNQADIQKFNKMMSIDSQLKSYRNSLSYGSPEHGSVFDSWSKFYSKKMQLSRELNVNYVSTIRNEFESDKTLFELNRVALKDKVFLDYVKFKKKESDPLLSKIQEDNVHYGVFILTNEGIEFLDLGKAEGLDKDIVSYIEFLRKPLKRSTSSRYTKLSKTLHKKFVTPILNKLSSSSNKFIISTDGELSSVPFEAFMGEDGHLFILENSTQYVTSSKALFAPTVVNSDRKNAVIVADPDYGDANLKKITDEIAYSSNRRNGVFLPLEGVSYEASSVSKILSENQLSVSRLEGSDATEAALKLLDSPSILHIATHGFAVKIKPSVIDAKETFVEINSDEVQTGIALANANKSEGELFANDGVLNWHEFATLNLNKTDLVVFSACDTAIGKRSNGQATQGMRRAAEITGAKASVTTLWSIPNNETIDVMVDFYHHLSNSKSKAESLRKAKLNLIKERPDPYYWAGFVLTESVL